MPAINPTPAPHLTILPPIHTLALAIRSASPIPSPEAPSPTASGISNTAIIGIVASAILLLGLLTCCAKVGCTRRRKRRAAEKEANKKKLDVRILGTGAKHGYAAYKKARGLDPRGFVANHHRETLGVGVGDLRPEALRI